MKESAKKHGITISLAVGLVTTAFQSYQAHQKVIAEKLARENYEIFVSNYQDEVNCKLDSLKAKKCN